MDRWVELPRRRHGGQQYGERYRGMGLERDIRGAGCRRPLFERRGRNLSLFAGKKRMVRLGLTFEAALADTLRKQQARPSHVVPLRATMPKTLSLLFLPALLFAQAPGLDWKKLQAETREHFSAMVRINSSNPPGNETVVAKYIQGVLEREGIPSKLVGTDPDRLSLIARLKGSGAKKPILIMGHTDVVGVQAERWS